PAGSGAGVRRRRGVVAGAAGRAGRVTVGAGGTPARHQALDGVPQRAARAGEVQGDVAARAVALVEAVVVLARPVGLAERASRAGRAGRVALLYAGLTVVQRDTAEAGVAASPRAGLRADASHALERLRCARVDAGVDEARNGEPQLHAPAGGA